MPLFWLSIVVAFCAFIYWAVPFVLDGESSLYAPLPLFVRRNHRLSKALRWNSKPLELGQRGHSNLLQTLITTDRILQPIRLRIRFDGHSVKPVTACIKEGAATVWYRGVSTEWQGLATRGRDAYFELLEYALKPGQRLELTVQTLPEVRAELVEAIHRVPRIKPDP